MSAVYGVVLAAALFLLLVLPGIVRPGSRVRFATEPRGAAVRIDGVYRGTTPCAVFIDAGTYTAEAVLPGFQSVPQSIDVGNRVLGSLFVPRSQTETLELSPPPSSASAVAVIFAEAAAEFAAWSFAGEPSSAWQIPLTLSDAAYRLSAGDTAPMTEVLEAALGFASTKAALRDALRAGFYLYGGPGNLLEGIRYWDSVLERYPEASAAGLAALLGTGSGSSSGLAAASKMFHASAWYKSAAAGTGAGASAGGAATAAEAADDGVNLEYFEDLPLYSGATWNEAAAACVRLTAELPAEYAGWEARLPTMAEAERISLPEGFFLWTSDPYYPVQGFPEPGISPEKRLRGGNGNGSLPPDYSSPVTGYRPVLAKKAR
jgi:hypothetical protein